MRRVLDGLYAVSGVLAALCLVAILTLVGVQIVARCLDTVLRAAGGQATGFLVPSLAEICGFLLAAASFLALADTLARGVHIRVLLLVEHVPDTVRRVLEAATGLAAVGLALFAAWSMGRLTLKSLEFGDVSYGMVAVPLALPQAVVTLGLLVFAVALADQAAAAIRGRPVAAASGE